MKKSCDEMEKVNKKLLALDEAFNDVLLKSKIDFIRNGSNNHVPGNINLSIRRTSGEMLLHRLDLMGICISTGSACDSVNTEVSHVIKASEYHLSIQKALFVFRLVETIQKKTQL